jgi:hypothetical protein
VSWWAKRSIFAKIFFVLAFAFIAGVGLCGVDATFLANLRDTHQEFGPNTFVGTIGAFALVLSALGLVVTTIAWSVMGLLGREDPEPQRLFDHPDDEEKSE